MGLSFAPAHLRKYLPFPGKRSVLLSASSVMNVVVLQPIVKVLEQDPRVQLWFTGKYQGGDDYREMARLGGLERVDFVTRRDARRLKADLYLSPDGQRFGKRCRAKVLLFHGVSFKGRSINHRARWFDRVFLVGEYQRRRFAALKILKDGDRRLASVGMPKLDRLVDGSIDAKAVRRRLGVKDGETCVLYAPTWTEHSSLFTLGEPLLAALAARPRTRVVVKLHDHLLDASRSPIDWRARIDAWHWENVSVASESDVVPLLAAADVLVTDASSVSQEFTLLDRPILFADVPGLFESERYKDSVDLETWGRKGGVVFRTAEEGRRALDRAIDAPHELAEVRRKIAADMFYGPGGATQRALDEVYRLLRLKMPAPQRG